MHMCRLHDCVTHEGATYGEHLGEVLCRAAQVARPLVNRHQVLPTVVLVPGNKALEKSAAAATHNIRFLGYVVNEVCRAARLLYKQILLAQCTRSPHGHVVMFGQLTRSMV